MEDRFVVHDDAGHLQLSHLLESTNTHDTLISRAGQSPVVIGHVRAEIGFLRTRDMRLPRVSPTMQCFLLLFHVLSLNSVHPSRHYEVRLSLSQLCGVNKAPLQLPSSGLCAPALIRRKESPPSSGAQHRGMASSCCRHGAADRVAKAATDGSALVETVVYWESVATVRAEELVGTAVPMHRESDQIRSVCTIERQSVRGPSATFHK